LFVGCRKHFKLRGECSGDPREGNSQEKEEEEIDHHSSEQIQEGYNPRIGGQQLESNLYGDQCSSEQKR
jgi:hypothetical protein